jgi:hypothetical protein
MKSALCTALQTPHNVAAIGVEAECSGFDIFGFTGHILYTEQVKSGGCLFRYMCTPLVERCGMA